MIPPATECPGFSLIAGCKTHQREGEDLFETVTRLLVAEALLLSSGVQKEAARALSTSPRVLNYHCKKWGWQTGRGGGPKKPDEVADDAEPNAT